MIIIFLNELKNITRSFYNINYINDVSNINIKKNCNNIYCEAETARFNLSKNTMDLLLPNDNFNSKTYFMFILLICVLLFLNFYYKFIIYNNKMLEYITNINGDYFINYISYFPYILLFVVVFMITVMMIRRYAPTDEKGYKAYFNVDNRYISAIVDDYNINVMHNTFMMFIILLLIIYLSTSAFSEVPNINNNNYKKKGDYYYCMAQTYIIAVLFSLYLMINIINIIFTFKENNEPKLDNKYYKYIYETKYNSVKELFKKEIYILDTTENPDYEKLKADSDMYKNYSKHVSILSVKFNELKKRVDIKDKNREKYPYSNYQRPVSEKSVFEYVNYIYENDKGNKINKDSYNELKDVDNINELETNINVVFNNKPEELKNYIHNKYIIINNLINDGKGEKDVLNIIYNDYNIINKYSDILEKIKEVEDFVNKIHEIKGKKIDEVKKDMEDMYLIKYFEYYQFAVNFICVHLIKYIIYYIEKNNKKINKIIKENNDENVLLSEIYSEQIMRIDLLININKLKDFYTGNGDKRITYEDLKYFDNKLKKYIDDYTGKLDKKGKNISQLFSENYDINKSEKEREKSFTADISYNNLNLFYENYFKIINLKKLSLDYYVGDFYIKNIETALIYIFLVLLILLFCIFILSNTYSLENFNPTTTFLYEIILPLCVLLIFVVYVYIFMNYNTKYNMYFIYGIINSSYNRDLTHLNNVIIPFLKLHDIDTTFTKNYYEHYIISNVLASILNGNINLELALASSTLATPAAKAVNAAVKAANLAYTAKSAVDAADAAKSAAMSAAAAARSAAADAVAKSAAADAAAKSAAARSAADDATARSAAADAVANPVAKSVAKSAVDAADAAKSAVDAAKFTTYDAKAAADAAAAAAAAAAAEAYNSADAVYAVIQSAYAANYAAIAAYHVANIGTMPTLEIITSDPHNNAVKNTSTLEKLIKITEIKDVAIIDHLNFDKKYESYNDIKSLNIKFKPFSDKDTINQDEFRKYYMKTYENIYNYNNFKKDYKIKSGKLELDELYEKKDEKTNIFSNILLNNIPKDIGDELNNIIQNKNDDRSSLINGLIPKIEQDIEDKIEKYKYIIYYIIEKCIKLFNHKNFLKNNNKYNEDIMKLFKFELTNNNLEATPYKFILNIKSTEEYNIFFNEYKKEENEKMKNIVENFIIINYHIAFNTLNMEKNIDYYNTIGDSTIKSKIIDNLNTRHIRYNKKLYGLLIESHDINDYDIDETFYELEDLKKLKDDNKIKLIKNEYKKLNYNYNILMRYESSNVTISNNYLKNIIKSIYYQINNKNINFEVENQEDVNKTYKININKKPDKETNIIENILHNSNYIKGQGLFINYVINIIFIAIIYNIGYNM